jgi:hypothetical protein
MGDFYKEAFELLEKAVDHIGPWSDYCPHPDDDKEAQDLHDKIKAFVEKAKEAT